MWNSILSLFANPVLVRASLAIIEFWAQENGIDSQEEQIFVKMAEVLRKLGATEAVSRFQSGAEQDSELDKEWEKEKKP